MTEPLGLAGGGGAAALDGVGTEAWLSKQNRTLLMKMCN